ISNRITELIKAEKLDQDLGIEAINSNSLRQFLTVADGYLCELKEAQIRDGLHIFGQCPQGSQLVDLIIAIARQPQGNLLGITQALAEDLDWSFDPLIFVEEGERGRGREWEDKKSISIRKLNQIIALFQLEKLNLDNLRNRGKAIEILEHLAIAIVSQVISEEREIENSFFSENLSEYLPETNKVISWIETTLLPALQKTSAEITNLLAGLNGNYVPSGAAGAPTRGRADVLPTGRNFYSVDIRGIPTETAWSVGIKAAEVLIERYTQENGEYPQNLAISIWGTSTMRTGGDDVAQVMALLGVRPIWDGVSRRVVDFEILSPAVLGRPRVDVTIRVSGFFRDAFPNILDLLYKAIAAVSSLKEAEKINPLAAQVRKETEFWQNQGLTKTQAKLKATHRIFGSKPGAYGAGLQGLIEAQNWQNDDDLARAYINWSSYAYGAEGKAFSEPEVFSKRLEKLQVILHNQDNREHDLLDSDDYYQFQGGLTAAVRSLTGKNPTIYFGDNSVPYNPKVRQLKEEINRVYRSRVVNPKWINSVMKHGYKGALEMAATVDYLFAYDATTKCVQDHLYQGITEAYLFDPKVQEFIANKNPWALRDIAERLIEAHQRSLWQSANSDTIEKLKTIVNHAEGIIENMH
ncbi:MAG: cobaltochelatase subunit CobN, partial [Cyanobacteria bacterium J083]